MRRDVSAQDDRTGRQALGHGEESPARWLPQRAVDEVGSARWAGDEKLRRPKEAKGTHEGARASVKGPARRGVHEGSAQARPECTDRELMLQNGKPRRATGEARSATAAGRNGLLRGARPRGQQAAACDGEGATVGGDAGTATQEGNALEGKHRRERSRPTHPATGGHGGSRNPMDFMVGCRMQQACEATGRTNRRGGEEPRGRTPHTPGKRVPKRPARGGRLGSAGRDVDGEAIFAQPYEVLGEPPGNVMDEAPPRARRVDRTVDRGRSGDRGAHPEPQVRRTTRTHGHRRKASTAETHNAGQVRV